MQKKRWDKKIKENWDVILLFLGAFFFIIYWKNFISFSTSNTYVLKGLVSYAFLFLWFIKRKILKTGEIILTLIGIVLVVHLFFIENVNQDVGKVNSLLAINRMNCTTVEEITKEKEGLAKGEQINLSYFLTNPYANYFGFVYEKYGIVTGDKIIESVMDMNVANRLLDLSFAANIEGANPLSAPVAGEILKWYGGEDLMKRVENAKKVVCEVKLFSQNKNQDHE